MMKLNLHLYEHGKNKVTHAANKALKAIRDWTSLIPAF